MSSDQQPTDDRTDPLENSALAHRLRRMEWPAAPPGVKERCLEEILARVNGSDRDE